MSQPPYPIPVVLIAFNRPACTKKLLEAVRIVRPTRIWQVVDGARPGRADEREKCEQVREILETGVDWDCDVHRCWSEENLGCGKRVVSGLDDVFRTEERAIILEDDCIPDTSFFAFCEQLLAEYRDENRVCQIGGANFGSYRNPRSYTFSRYTHIWGWATWRRAWSHFDWEMHDWPEARESGWLENKLGSRSAAAYWTDAFDSVYHGKIDTWDFRWTYTAWRRDWLSIHPGTNLVENIGFGAEATHTKKAEPILMPEVKGIEFPLATPEFVQNLPADDLTERRLYSGDWTRRLRRRASKTVRGLGRSLIR